MDNTNNFILCVPSGVAYQKNILLLVKLMFYQFSTYIYLYISTTFYSIIILIIENKISSSKNMEMVIRLIISENY